MREKYIIAIVWYFGFNRKQAIEYIKTADTQMLNGILERYNQNAKQTFYND